MRQLAQLAVLFLLAFAVQLQSGACQLRCATTAPAMHAAGPARTSASVAGDETCHHSLANLVLHGAQPQKAFAARCGTAPCSPAATATFAAADRESIAGDHHLPTTPAAIAPEAWPQGLTTVRSVTRFRHRSPLQRSPVSPTLRV